MLLLPYPRAVRPAPSHGPVGGLSAALCNPRWLLSASGVMEARGGGFGYDDGSRRSAVAGEHEGFLSSWPQWTRSTLHPCLTTRSASPWCASTACQRASVALDAAAISLPGVRVALRRPQRDSAGRAPPAAADLGVVPLLHGSEPVQPADRRGTGSRHLGRAAHDRADGF